MSRNHSELIVSRTYLGYRSVILHVCNTRTAADCGRVPTFAKMRPSRKPASGCDVFLHTTYISLWGEMIMMHAASRCNNSIISYVGYIAFAL